MQNDNHQTILNNFEEKARRINEDGEKEFEKITSKFDKLEKEIEHSRLNARDVIYKIILLSSSIIAFSASLVSIKFLNIKIDILTLFFSWKLFLVVIIIGFIILFIEPRLKISIIWRHFLQNDKLLGSLSDQELLNNKIVRKNLKIYWGIILSIIYPENIFLDKLNKDGYKIKNNSILSFNLLSSLATWRKIIIYWGENIFLFLFIISLTIFISSFRF